MLDHNLDQISCEPASVAVTGLRCTLYILRFVTMRLKIVTVWVLFITLKLRL